MDIGTPLTVVSPGIQAGSVNDCDSVDNYWFVGCRTTSSVRYQHVVVSALGLLVGIANSKSVKVSIVVGFAR